MLVLLQRLGAELAHISSSHPYYMTGNDDIPLSDLKNDAKYDFLSILHETNEFLSDNFDENESIYSGVGLDCDYFYEEE